MKLTVSNPNFRGGHVQEPVGFLARLRQMWRQISRGGNGAHRRCQGGFSLAEVVMSMGLTAVIVAGAARAHVAAADRADWSSCSFAAQNAAAQRAEQVRSARWDNLSNPPVDQVVGTNFQPQVTVLEVPSIGTNVVTATNFTSISELSLDPPIRVIRTDCVWRFSDRGLFTNSHLVYRGPDQ